MNQPQTAASRRGRYSRDPQEISLTPQKWRLLTAIAECRVVSSHQLARLLDLGEKTTRYHLRQLFDAGLTDVVPVSRMSLVDPAMAIDHGILFGSAPNVYTPTKDGLKLLTQVGLVDESVSRTAPYKYSVRNSMYLAHELMVRDVYVWLKRLPGWTVERWDTGDAAAVALSEKRIVRPDALAVVTNEQNALVAFVEADRGTERGNKRWAEKCDNYIRLMTSEQLKETTGYTRARVLVTVPNEARAAQLKALIESLIAAKGLPKRRFYIAQEGALTDADMNSQVWLVPGESGLQSIV